MMLTIFASMAQEESKSISENVKWGVRSRMKRGARKVTEQKRVKISFTTFASSSTITTLQFVSVS